MLFFNKLVLSILIINLIVLIKFMSVTADSSSDKLSILNSDNKNEFDDSKLLEAKKKFREHGDGDDDDDDDDDHHHEKIVKEKLRGDSSEEEDGKKKGHKHHRHHENSLGFVHAFFASISVIVVSEIGDKTFFIAAIMAMKHPRAIVYGGAMFALGLMTFLSAFLGNIVTKVIPRTYTYYFSSLLFAIFGIKMLREGLQMSKDETTDEEYEEAQQSLRKSEEEENINSAKNLEAGLSGVAPGDKVEDSNDKWYTLTRKFVVSLRKYISPIFLQAFILTFLAEWGDRSQISTIILGARENIAGTILGGSIGHGLCTGMAVLGGRLVAQRISVRNVTLCGAVVFLFFAISAFFIDPEFDD